MTGVYTVEIYNSRVHYNLRIKRNITILQGDSATGKSEMIRMIADYNSLSASSGVTIVCERPCVVLSGSDWKLRLSAISGSIVFVDEGQPFVRSGEFSESIRGTDNYYVLVYRDALPQLPYSIEEIYAFRIDRESQKYHQPKKLYNEMQSVYRPLQHTERANVPEILITEDATAGYTFFSNLFTCESVSSGGKSNVLNCLRQYSTSGKGILVIVDGAAFGAEMGKVMRYIRNQNTPCTVYAPESFENLLLRAGFGNASLDCLDNTFEYADTKEYFSWEEYYTALLTELTRDTVYRYSKHRIGNQYLTEGSLRRVRQVMPESLWQGKT